VIRAGSCRQIIISDMMVGFDMERSFVVIASVAKQSSISGFTPSGHEGKGKIPHTLRGMKAKVKYHSRAAFSGSR